MVGTGGCHTASKPRPSAMTQRLKRCSRRVRPCAPMKQCSICLAAQARSLAKVQVRTQMRLRDRVLLSVAQMSSPKKRKGTSRLVKKCTTTVVEADHFLACCEDAMRRPPAVAARPTPIGGAGSASAEPRRRITGKRPMRPVERREEQQSGGGDDPNREEPPTRRHRVARAAVQLRALVAMESESDRDPRDVTLCLTAVGFVMGSSQSCKNRACKTT